MTDPVVEVMGMGHRPLPTEPPPRDVDAWRAEMLARSDAQRYFRTGELAAAQSQVRSVPRVDPPPAEPRPRRKAAPAPKKKAVAAPKARTQARSTPPPAASTRPDAGRLVACRKCGKLTRPSGTRREDFPDQRTVKRGGYGCCQTCYLQLPPEERPHAQTHSRRHAAAAKPLLRPCPGCGDMTRPPSRSRDDFPQQATVLRVAGDLCKPCHTGKPRRNLDPRVIRPCAKCKRQTRPASRKANEFEFETVPRSSATLCSACYVNPARKGPKEKP